MKALLCIVLLLGATLFASCRRESKGSEVAAKTNAPATMTDGEIVALVQSIVNPPPTPWGERSIAMVIKAVRAADNNAVVLIRDILLMDRFRPEFSSPDTEAWQAESSHLYWQQFTAVQAAQRPDVFGETLVSYFYGGGDALDSLTAENQIRMAALKLIQKGTLYAARVDASTEQYNVAKHSYSVTNIAVEGETATAEAAFLKPLAGNGYRIRFKRIIIQGRPVWLPIAKEETWIS